MTKFLNLTFFFTFLTLASSAQKIHIKKNQAGFWLLENDKKIFFFQRELNDSLPLHARNNYFHPIYDLNGISITEDFPEDHLHHRGLFWAWQQIMVNQKIICDSWNIKNFTQNVDHVDFHQNKEDIGIFSYSTFWHTKNQPDDPFLREKTKVSIYPATNKYRRIDFKIQLRALEKELSIGGSNDEKGIGGFSIRLLTDSLSLFSDSENNKVYPQNLAIKQEGFIDISNKKKKWGITLLPWSSNPDSNRWILRQSGSIQNCAWPGQDPIKLLPESPVTLNYTLIIHRGKRKIVPYQKIIDSFTSTK